MLERATNEYHEKWATKNSDDYHSRSTSKRIFTLLAENAWLINWMAKIQWNFKIKSYIEYLLLTGLWVSERSPDNSLDSIHQPATSATDSNFSWLQPAPVQACCKSWLHTSNMSLSECHVLSNKHVALSSSAYRYQQHMYIMGSSRDMIAWKFWTLNTCACRCAWCMICKSCKVHVLHVVTNAMSYKSIQ